MLKIHIDKLGEVAQVFHPRTWEVQAREGQDHPSLNSKFEAWLQETLSLNKCCGLMRYTEAVFKRHFPDNSGAVSVWKEATLNWLANIKLSPCFILCVCVCTTLVPGAFGGQKKSVGSPGTVVT